MSSAALSGLYRASDGRTIPIDPTHPLPADVLADVRARIPAGVPLTRDTTLTVSMASDAAVEGAGREIFGVLPTGTPGHGGGLQRDVAGLEDAQR